MGFDLQRLRLTWSEEQILKRIARAVPAGGALAVSRLADDGRITRSVAANALRKASIAGVIDTRSLGMRGTMIVVRDADAWSEIGRSA